MGGVKAKEGVICAVISTPNLQPQNITKRPREGDNPQLFRGTPNRHQRSSGVSGTDGPFPRMRFTSAEHLCKTAWSPVSQNREGIQSIRHHDQRYH